MNKFVFYCILVCLFVLASLVAADANLKVTLEQNEKIIEGFVDDGQSSSTKASTNASGSSTTTNAGAAASNNNQQSEPKKQAEQPQQTAAPVVAAEQPKQKQQDAPAKKEAAAPAKAEEKKVVAKTTTTTSAPIVQKQPTSPATSKPTANEILHPTCKNKGMFGPSNINGEKETEYQEHLAKKGCRLCTVDCAAIWAFAANYGAGWFQQRPNQLYVIEASTCKCRYYNYGCQKNTHCASYSSHDEMLSAISFCMIHNGCQLQGVNNQAAFLDFVSKFAQIGDTIKKNSRLMEHETKILKDLGVRAGIIYHYKRVQDIRDALIAGADYDRFAKSAAGTWDLAVLPKFVYDSLEPIPISKALFDRVKFKIEVLKYLPEDDALKQVREKAQQQLELSNDVENYYEKLKSFNFNVFEKIELSYKLGNAYFDLLTNEIDSLQIATYLTRESEQAENEYKKVIDERMKRLAASAATHAQIALFKLFLGSWNERKEALIKLGKLLIAELNVKVMVHMNKLAGKVSDAASVAIATMKNGALHAARQITGVSSAAAYNIKYGVLKGADAVADTSKMVGRHVAGGVTYAGRKLGDVGKRSIRKLKGVGKKIGRGFRKIGGIGKRSFRKLKGIGKRSIRKLRSVGRKIGRGFRKIGGGFRKISGGFRKIGGGFRRVGRSVRKISRGFKSAGRKITGGFRKIGGGFRRVGRSVRKISRGFKSAGRKISRGFRSVGRKIGRFFRF